MSKITDYFKFISSQLGHMQLNNYCLFFFSLGVQLMIMLDASITWISVLTFIGTTLGVLCVIAINAAKSVNGWLGILSGICFIIIGFNAKNYLSICEQIAYMITLDIPVLINVNWNKNMASKIRKFTPKKWILAIGFTIVVAIISGLLMAKFTNDGRPAFDAISFAVDLTGGLVCFLRYNNQYCWWLAGSIFQIVLWFITLKQGASSPGMLVNYLIYLTNDILAFSISPWYNRKARIRAIAKEKK